MRTATRPHGIFDLVLVELVGSILYYSLLTFNIKHSPLFFYNALSIVIQFIHYSSHGNVKAKVNKITPYTGRF